MKNSINELQTPKIIIKITNKLEALPNLKTFIIVFDFFLLVFYSLLLLNETILKK